MKAPPPVEAAARARRTQPTVESVLPGRGRGRRAARRSLDGEARGFSPGLALPRPRLRRRRRLHRPRQLRDQHRRRRQVRLPAALGDPLGQPDRDGRPDPVGEARHRDRQEPRRALPRALLAPHLDRALDPGRDRRDGDRHRRGRRRRARPQPALRHPALPGRGDRRRRRLRDPRPAADGLPAARGRDHGAGRRRRRLLRLRALPRQSRRRRSRQAPLRAGLRRHREHPAGDRDHRRDGDAARRLPALGADPAPDRRPRRRREEADPALREDRRRDRDVARRAWSTSR